MQTPPTTPALATDAQLVALLAVGRQDALSALYDRYSPLLLAVGMRVLTDRREVEDVVHDVFVEAWRSAGQYDASRGTVRAWLVTRMRSRAMDRRKSAGFSRSVSLEASGYEWAASEDDPGRHPDRERVRRVMGSLPPEHRQVLELAYFDGLSCSEIAERVGLPIGTVKSRAAAALSRMRDGLGVPKEDA